MRVSGDQLAEERIQPCGWNPGFPSGQRGVDRLPLLQVAFDKSRAWIKGAAMTFAQVIENGNFVALIKKQLCADAADITGPANNENFHAP